MINLHDIKQNPLIRVVLREVERISSSWMFVFVAIVAPAVAYTLIYALFSQGVVRNLPVAVCDCDQSALSRQVIRLIDATAAANVVYRCTSDAEAIKLMKRGKIDAFLSIPANTERDVIRGSAPHIGLFVNNTNIVKGGVLQSALGKTLATVSAGIKLQVYAKTGKTGTDPMGAVLPVRLSSHVLYNPFGNYSYFLAVGLLSLMVVVFTFLGSVYAVGIELKEGTGPEWLGSANNSILVALAGKFLPWFFLFLINVLAVNYIFVEFMGLPIKGNVWVLILVGTVMIWAYQGMSVVFLALTANLRLSLSLGSAYTLMALTFSGLTFPLLAMPPVAKVFAHIFPFTYWLKLVLSQSLRGEALVNTVGPIAVMLVFIALGIAMMPKLKRILLDEKYWGKV